MDLRDKPIRYAPDANLGAITDGQTLIWNAATQKFDAGTISSANIYNSDGTLTGDRVVTTNGFDLIFDGQTVDNLLYLDSSANSIGIGTAGPTARLEVKSSSFNSTDIVYKVSASNSRSIATVNSRGDWVLGTSDEGGYSRSFTINNDGNRGVNDIIFTFNSNAGQPVLRAWQTSDGTLGTGGAIQVGSNVNNIITRCAAIGLGVNRFYGTQHWSFTRPTSTQGWVRIGLESSATAALTVDAQGTLSTDNVFDVRNSGNTDNIFSVKGNRNIYLLGETSNGRIELSASGGIATLKHRATAVLPSHFIIGSFGDGGSVGQIVFDALDGTGTYPTFTMQRLISGLSDLTGSSLYSGFGTNAATFVMKNALNYASIGIIPTGTAADHFAMYSADQGSVAGRASVHFRSEEGTVNSLGYFNGFGYTSGTALGARIDILAQGALSSDIVQRWRNSADSSNIGLVTGDGAFTMGTYTNPNTKLSITDTNLGIFTEAIKGIMATGSGNTTVIGGDFLGRASTGAANTSTGVFGKADGGNSGGTNFGIRGDASGAGNNYAGYFDAQGGVSNYGLFIQRGDIQLGSTAGYKIGAFAATPIIQPTTATGAATFVANTSVNFVYQESTFDGYTIEQVVKALRNLGWLA